MYIQNPDKKAIVGVAEAPSDQPAAYEMRVRGVWHPCSQGKEMPKGWLEFRTPDGKKGLAPFGTWRRVARKS